MLDWYDGAHRSLPWRVPPGSLATPDPYRVWLSEIMLQQTTVAAVIPHFEKFTRSWPTLEALAAANDEDVMHAWAGLGYYARARNLLACARAVGDRFPDSEADLRALPGVGAYTAAAIAAIAFGRRAVVVDGNVERVVARLFAVETPLPAAKPQLRALAERITPDLRAGDFAQAMMDLGATLCRPRDVDCRRCPLAGACKAHARGSAAAYPRREAKKPRPMRHGSAYWLETDGRVLLIRRPKSGLLGGMLALPASAFTLTAPAAGTWPGAPAAVNWRAPVARVSHVFTHFKLQLDLYAARGNAVASDAIWVERECVVDAGLPTVFKKAAHALLSTTATWM